MSELDPRLSAERLNKVTTQSIDEFKSLLDTGLKHVMQTGYPLGALPYRSKISELRELQQRHQRNLQIALMPNAYEGDKVRAQKELQRERALTEEVLGEPAAQT